MARNLCRTDCVYCHGRVGVVSDLYCKDGRNDDLPKYEVEVTRRALKRV